MCQRFGRLGLLLLALACAADRTERVEPELVVGSSNSEAELRRLLIQKQRALLEHIYDRELAELTEMLDPQFTWTLRTPAAGLGGDMEPEKLSYLEVVAGSYPTELGIEATTFDVEQMDSSAAIVRAGLIHVPYGATTQWRRINGEWKAVWMVGLPIEG